MGSRRIAIALAALVSAPAVVLAVLAFGSILLSVATDDFYRRTFLDYGLKLCALYALFVAGMMAGAWLAMRELGAYDHWGAILLCAAGVLAAAALEVQFWTDAGSFPQRGMFVLPFLAWVIVAAYLRRRRLPDTI